MFSTDGGLFKNPETQENAMASSASEAPILIGCIADDLTGATDLAVTLMREGLSAIQINGVPGKDLRLPPGEAVVVALKSRTIPAPEAVSQSLAALAWLRGRGAARIYFKYCSTFDSTPQGNIGPVADALLHALGSGFTVATPAYPRNRRTVFMGHLFVDEVLLSDSGMRRHPLTPMTDANLLRVLSAQTDGKVGLVPYTVVSRGAEAIRRRLEELQSGGYRYAVVDAVDDDHLIAAGAACAELPLTTGGAGLAMGLAHHLVETQRGGKSGGVHAALPAAAGPAVILSGSCSAATLAQVKAAVGRLPSFKLDPVLLAQDEKAIDSVLQWAVTSLGAVPLLVYATVEARELAAVQAKLGRERAAEIVEKAFRTLAKRLLAAGVRRFVVAGGETSGAVVEALGARALRIGPEISPGVPWTATLEEPVCLLALKSGNFGGPDFFTRAFEVRGGREIGSKV
jgi:uncharacterized protein YgbK (DUF1537 family)